MEYFDLKIDMFNIVLGEWGPIEMKKRMYHTCFLIRHVPTTLNMDAFSYMIPKILEITFPLRNPG